MGSFAFAQLLVLAELLVRPAVGSSWGLLGLLAFAQLFVPAQLTLVNRS